MQNKSNYKKGFKKIFFSFFFILFIFFIFFIYIFFNLYFYKLNRDVSLDVYQGMTIKNLIDYLDDYGLKGNKNIYYFYARFLKPGFVLKKGFYKLKKDYNFIKIIEIVGKGVSELKKVTIPPGLKLTELIEFMDKNNIISKNSFKNILSDKEFFKKWPIIYQYNSLEGFIFPETYFYSEDLKPSDVLSIFINEFFKQVNKILDIESYSTKELYYKIIVASLIEEEAFLEEEKPLIASVIYNRLKKGMRLELCPTVQYILPKHKKYLTYEDLNIKSPYNTYINKGLPPTPICNPTLSSLKAAFFPADTDYLFYVSKGDGSHFFSKSFEEHLKYKRKSKFY